MLSFDSQNEYDYFMSYLKINADAVSNITDFEFNIFVDSLTSSSANVSGFVWYTSGKPMSVIKVKWAAGEPNNAKGGDEFCVTIKRYEIGLNDFSCSKFMENWMSQTIVCQKTKRTSQRGFKKRN